MADSLGVLAAEELFRRGAAEIGRMMAGVAEVQEDAPAQTEGGLRSPLPRYSGGEG